MNLPIKRALLSVADKTGIVEFAKKLVSLNIEIISTGGTSQLLRDAHIPHCLVEEVTGLPDLFEGRVKTLHPQIHAGILGKRDKHAAEAKRSHIQWIDLVVVNFYPFADATKQAHDWDSIVEYIDIGGPTMVRAAAKNFAWVGVVVDPIDYSSIINKLNDNGMFSLETRAQLAQKAFALTAQYDNMIHAYFQRQITTTEKKIDYPSHLSLQLEKVTELRYGENPHQQACAYQFSSNKTGILSTKQHQGKTLSYNNILDAEAAAECVKEFELPTCVIVKHANPCGVASADQIDRAYLLAYQSDPTSAFGGIVAMNRMCTEMTAAALINHFIEVVIAPSYSKEALEILSNKPNLRVLSGLDQNKAISEMRFIQGGVLLQEKDNQEIGTKDLAIATILIPSEKEIQSMLFAWRVLKHIKSNAILIAKNHQTIGMGAGQVSRIDAVDIALRKADQQAKGAVLASDAFFPFRDSIDRLADSGIRAIIQPGGSVRDPEVITACNEHRIAMVLTGRRCFKH